MRKILCIISVVSILLTMSVSVFAGDIPESLLSEDYLKFYLLIPR